MASTTSTKGTSATAAPNASGAMLSTAPTSRPPALPPRIANLDGDVQPCSTR